MVRRVTIGPATLLCGDFLEAAPALAAAREKATLCVCDPAYRLTSGGRSKNPRSMKGIFAPENYANDGKITRVLYEWHEWVPALPSILAERADVYLMCNSKNVMPAMVALKSAGFKEHEILVWIRNTATQQRFYMNNRDFTLYWFKGRARDINHPGSRAAINYPVAKVTAHENEKPVGLMLDYIQNSSNPGDLVIDPMMGSGTTGVAAIQAGRRFVGVELDDYWFDRACARIERAVMDGLSDTNRGTA